MVWCVCVVAGIIKVGGRVVVGGVVAGEWCKCVRIFLEVVLGICGGCGMCSVGVVVWPVHCICGGVSAVGVGGRVGWVERCAGGQSRCRCMPPVAMPWVWGGVFQLWLVL